MSNSLWHHGLQHARLPCPTPTPRDCSNSSPSSRWHHPTISFSVIPFSSCLQSFSAPGVGDEQGGLACCVSWGCKESDTTERLKWTELNRIHIYWKYWEDVTTSWPTGWMPVIRGSSSLLLCLKCMFGPWYCWLELFQGCNLDRVMCVDTFWSEYVTEPN